jgi:hypothetical protein
LSETESARLEAFAKSAGVTPFAVLHAAFCDTLCERAGQEEVIMCSIVGRQDASLRNFIGSDTDLIAQKYRRDGAGLAEKARHVSAANQTAVRHLPSDMLLPDSSLASRLAQQGVTLWRFAVHNSFPSGRLSSSPFKKLFWGGLAQKISFGFMSFESMQFHGDRHALQELILKVNHLPAGTNVTIAGDVGAYEPDELAQIVQDMIGKIPT